jgi:hypothetical protein
MSTIEREAGARASRTPLPTLRQIFWGALAKSVRRIAEWRRQGMLGKHNVDRRRRALRFEALEPRLLLSADLTYSAVASGDLTLRASDVDGIGTLELVDTASPGVVLASRTIIDIDGASGYGARIDAAGHDITLRIDASAELAAIAGGIVFVGGDGTSVLAGADLANTWTLAGAGSGGVGSVSFSGVEQLIGGSEADTLAGWGDDLVWNVTGGDAGDVAGTLFAGMENLLGAADNEDTFVFQAGASLSGLVHGGDGGFDTLVVEGGEYTTVTFTPTGPDSGSVSLDGNVITYAGLEPVLVNAGSASEAVFNLTEDDDGALVSQSGSTITIASTSATFELTDFPAPSASLTINGGDGYDTITIDSLNLGTASLSVSAETINVTGTLVAGTVNLHGRGFATTARSRPRSGRWMSPCPWVSRAPTTPIPPRSST